MSDDSELLRRYAEARSQDAFAELVQRHLTLVYSTALRQAGGDAHLAQDVTQMVFTDLARKAAALARRPVLAGWLHTSTRFAAAKVVRTERRRQAREEKAHAQEEILRDPDASLDWERVRPVIDDALGELGELDREVVLLRYFEGQPLAAVGVRLAVTESAARSRVDRALDKLRAVLARRGVTSTSAALGVALANQASVAAPAGLAANVTGAAITAAAAGVGGLAGLLIFMSTSKISLGVIGVVALLATGATVYQTAELRRSNSALVAANATQEALRSKLNEFEARAATDARRVLAVEADNVKLLDAVEGLKASHAAQTAETNAPITQNMVDARFKHARELAQSGDSAAALKEYLWCFDVGMPRVSGFSGVRRSYVLGEVAKLGETYPAALAALAERRDAAEKRLLASTNDYDAAADFSAINRYLKEDARTLAVYDQLPPDDTRRRGLGITVYDLLVDAGRYQDAVQVRSYSMMSEVVPICWTGGTGN